MKQYQFFFVLLLLFCLIAEGQVKSFNKVRYNGGSIRTAVEPDDWENNLTVKKEMITFALKDGQVLEIAPSKITALAYGQEARRKVAGIVAFGKMVGGLFHKRRQHYVSIEYDTSDGKGSALLLQADKDNYREMLIALKDVTSVPISVSEDEAESIPAGVETKIVKESDIQAEEQTKTSASEEKTLCRLNSTPEGAEIFVDDAFVGNAPAQLKLPPGKHQIKMVMKGYQDWSRTVDILAGSEISLNAVLVK